MYSCAMRIQVYNKKFNGIKSGCYHAKNTNRGSQEEEYQKVYLQFRNSYYRIHLPENLLQIEIKKR